MALPPKGDPRRPLALAIRSTRALGAVFLLFGLVGMAPLLLLRGGGVPRIYAIALLISFAPGALYLICSIFLARRSYAAVVTSLVLVAVHTLFLFIGAVGLAVGILSASELSVALWFGVGLLVLFIVALAQLI